MKNFFDFLYETYLEPAYVYFKNLYPSSAYSNYTKNDTHYYRITIPKIVSIINKFWIDGVNHRKFYDKYLEPSDNYRIYLKSNGEIFEEHKPGLSQELTEYRKKQI